jgi:hypothetical protein
MPVAGMARSYKSPAGARPLLKPAKPVAGMARSYKSPLGKPAHGRAAPAAAASGRVTSNLICASCSGA